MSTYAMGGGPTAMGGMNPQLWEMFLNMMGGGNF